MKLKRQQYSDTAVAPIKFRSLLLYAFLNIIFILVFYSPIVVKKTGGACSYIPQVGTEVVFEQNNHFKAQREWLEKFQPHLDYKNNENYRAMLEDGSANRDSWRDDNGIHFVDIGTYSCYAECYPKKIESLLEPREYSVLSWSFERLPFLGSEELSIKQALSIILTVVIHLIVFFFLFFNILRTLFLRDLVIWKKIYFFFSLFNGIALVSLSAEILFFAGAHLDTEKSIQIISKNVSQMEAVRRGVSHIVDTGIPEFSVPTLDGQESILGSSCKYCYVINIDAISETKIDEIGDYIDGFKDWGYHDVSLVDRSSIYTTLNLTSLGWILIPALYLAVLGSVRGLCDIAYLGQLIFFSKGAIMVPIELGLREDYVNALHAIEESLFSEPRYWGAVTYFLLIAQTLLIFCFLYFSKKFLGMGRCL